jgi:hypothetical protein
MPAFLVKSSLFTGVLLGYLCSVVSYGMLTGLSMIMNGELRYWRLAFALPASPLYVFLFNWLPGAVGATCDVLLFGNVTGFAPESTLIKGGSVRIALLSRLWRAFSLTVRSVVYGDVPLGRFWLGWGETSWTPSGFEGFTTKRRRRIVPPLTEWFRKPRAIPGFMPGLSDVEPTNDGSRHA